MTPEERRRIQREVQDAMNCLSPHNKQRLLRLAQHLAQHKLLSQLYLGADDAGPDCLCIHQN